MQRFFIPTRPVIGQPIALVGDQAHQVRRVLRMRPGDRAILLDGRGDAYESVLDAIGEAEVQFRVTRRCETTGEPATRITLYQAALKGERFGWALQKGVEVGVSAFAPLICARNVVEDLAAVESKRGRWERIIQEAAEQCGRSRLPELRSAQRFADAISAVRPSPENAPSTPPASRGARFSPGLGGQGGEAWLILWEGEHEARLRTVLGDCNVSPGASIQLWVGPEGGFSDAEIALARSHGVRPVSLGPRILRAETAGVVAAALILYELGDM